MTTRVNKNKEPYDVYIGRGSKWGCPFTHIKGRKTKAQFVVSNRKEAISKYKEYLLNSPELLNDIEELRNKVLGCFCDKNKSCHGDILIAILEERKYYSLF